MPLGFFSGASSRKNRDPCRKTTSRSALRRRAYRQALPRKDRFLRRWRYRAPYWCLGRRDQPGLPFPTRNWYCPLSRSGAFDYPCDPLPCHAQFIMTRSTLRLMILCSRTGLIGNHLTHFPSTQYAAVRSSLFTKDWKVVTIFPARAALQFGDKLCLSWRPRALQRQVRSSEARPTDPVQRLPMTRIRTR
jgi:hypothetical protein